MDLAARRHLLIKRFPPPPPKRSLNYGFSHSLPAREILSTPCTTRSAAHRRGEGTRLHHRRGRGGGTELEHVADHVHRIHRTHHSLRPIPGERAVQPLACHVAVLRGTNRDQPRKPAKSVTVEQRASPDVAGCCCGERIKLASRIGSVSAALAEPFSPAVQVSDACVFPGAPADELLYSACRPSRPMTDQSRSGVRVDLFGRRRAPRRAEAARAAGPACGGVPGPLKRHQRVRAPLRRLRAERMVGRRAAPRCLRRPFRASVRDETYVCPTGYPAGHAYFPSRPRARR
jgi:hypothetical protein